ncbi:MAG: SHOCT domain-containing protein [Euryarchaeota archaeon]|nr:SHOCT domain-containing protein [Euryarchaeota archaeon]
MDRWLSWLQDHPFGGALLILAAGGVGLTVLSVLLVPVFILAESSAVLGFFAFFVLLFMSGFGVQQLRGDDRETKETDTVDPVTELEGRYVRGELTDEEFEHRLDKIVETEDGIHRAETDRTRRASREVETERT